MHLDGQIILQPRTVEQRIALASPESTEQVYALDVWQAANMIPKIRKQEQQSFVESLALVFAEVYIMTGLKEDNYPDDSAAIYLMNMIRKHFGELHFSEIKLAFELGSVGMFEGFDDFKFQTFTWGSIAKLINNYKEYKAKAIHTAKMIAAPALPPPTEAEVEVKREAVRLELIEGFIKLYSTMLSQDLELDWDNLKIEQFAFPEYYNLFDDAGIYIPSKSERQKAWDAALNSSLPKRSIAESLIDTLTPDPLKRERKAKTILFKLILKILIREEVDPSQLKAELISKEFKTRNHE